MKNILISNFLFGIKFCLVAFALCSCQEVIEIDLNEADRKYVIDGGVHENDEEATVRITKTTNFFDTNPPEGVNNATVNITMPNDDIVTLNSIGNGYYRSTGLTFPTQSNYALQVEIEDKTFTANSYMPASVSIDSIYYEFQPAQFGDDAGYNVYIVYNDPIGLNYYNILSSVNGKLLDGAEDLLSIDDNLNDGNRIIIPVFTHLYEPGDTVVVELQSIDKPTYKFYQTFASLANGSAGDPFSAAPSNPETNITGGALGIFGSYTSSKRSIILPE